MSLVLSGCVTQKMVNFPQQSAAEAMVTFNALGYGEWPAHPYAHTEVLCGAKRIEINMAQVKYAFYYLRQSKLMFSVAAAPCTATQTFNVNDAEDATRLVAAANSLGASIENLRIFD